MNSTEPVAFHYPSHVSRHSFLSPPLPILLTANAVQRFGQLGFIARCSSLCQANLKGLPTRYRCIHHRKRFVRYNAYWPNDPIVVAGVGIGRCNLNSLFLRIMLMRSAPICKICWLRMRVQRIQDALSDTGLPRANSSPQATESSYAAKMATTMHRE